MFVLFQLVKGSWWSKISVGVLEKLSKAPFLMRTNVATKTEITKQKITKNIKYRLLVVAWMLNRTMQTTIISVGMRGNFNLSSRLPTYLPCYQLQLFFTKGYQKLICWKNVEIASYLHAITFNKTKVKK